LPAAVIAGLQPASSLPLVNDKRASDGCAAPPIVLNAPLTYSPSGRSNRL